MKNKKILSIFSTVLTVILLFSSCAVDVSKNEDEEPLVPVSISDLDLLSKSEYDPEPELSEFDKSFMELHYVDTQYSITDEAACVESFVNSNASSAMKNSYSQNKNVDILPIYGKYLEPTNLAVIAGYDNQGKVAYTYAVMLNENSDGIKEEWSRNLPYKGQSGYLNDWEAELKEVKDRIQRHFVASEAEAVALQYKSCYYLDFIYKKAGDDTYYSTDSNGLSNFYGIDRITDLSEGREKYVEFLTRKQDLHDSLCLFKAQLSLVSMATGAAWGTPKENVDFLCGDYNQIDQWYIEVALLDENYKSGKYAYGLIMSRSTIIGEVIVEKREDDYYVTALTNAEKDSNGNYVEQTSKMIDLVKKARENAGDIEIAGIRYDGKNLSILGTLADEVFVFDSQTNKFVEAKR